MWEEVSFLSPDTEGGPVRVSGHRSLRLRRSGFSAVKPLQSALSPHSPGKEAAVHGPAQGGAAFRRLRAERHREVPGNLHSISDCALPHVLVRSFTSVWTRGCGLHSPDPNATLSDFFIRSQCLASAIGTFQLSGDFSNCLHHIALLSVRLPVLF